MLLEIANSRGFMVQCFNKKRFSRTAEMLPRFRLVLPLLLYRLQATSLHPCQCLVIKYNAPPLQCRSLFIAKFPTSLFSCSRFPRYPFLSLPLILVSPSRFPDDSSLLIHLCVALLSLAHHPSSSNRSSSLATFALLLLHSPSLPLSSFSPHDTFSPFSHDKHSLCLRLWFSNGRSLLLSMTRPLL